jgi:isoquinoline 1-oxidoreductase beta subunit
MRWDSVLLSKALKRPVKVMWTREDDFANDFFRPASQCRIRPAWIKTAGCRLVAQGCRTVRHVPADAPICKGRHCPDAVSGVGICPIPCRTIGWNYVDGDPSRNVGFWRSVGYSVNAFTVESFMDELAHAAGKDPVQFRLDHMEKGPDPTILSLLAEKGRLENARAQGRARGVAVNACFESFAAHMAEVSVAKTGRHRSQNRLRHRLRHGRLPGCDPGPGRRRWSSWG